MVIGREQAALSCIRFTAVGSSYFTFNLMFAVVLLNIAFIMFSYVACIPDLYKTFNLRGCCIFSKAFSASNEKILWLCLEVLFFGVYFITLMDFHILTYSSITKRMPPWSWWIMVWWVIKLILWEFSWVFLHQYS